MKIGFLFPGQGAQAIGMGKDLYEKYEQYRNVYKKVNDITGKFIDKITFEGTEENLCKTENTQICILTMSLAILNLLENKNIKADACMGLSLGEYTSLIYSNALSFEDGVIVVEKRGKLMQELCPDGDWAMIAILGLDEEKIHNICTSVKSGFIAPANYNCIGQIVLSGERVAIQEAVEKAKNEGAKKVVELKTSGPFHTKMLSKAAEELKNELNNIKINDFKVNVIKNLDGALYKKDDNIPDLLAKHIISPVRFDIGIQTMLNLNIDTFVEIGPGKTLSGFVKRTNKDVNILNINNVETLETTIDFLKNGGKNG